MAADNSKAAAELARIRWRSDLMLRPEGVAWLAAQAKAGARERDLGPHRTDVLEDTHG